MFEALKMKTEWQTKKEISFCIQILNLHAPSQKLIKWDYIPEVTFQAFVWIQG